MLKKNAKTHKEKNLEHPNVKLILGYLTGNVHLKSFSKIYLQHLSLRYFPLLPATQSEFVFPEFITWRVCTRGRSNNFTKQCPRMP